MNYLNHLLLKKDILNKQDLIQIQMYMRLNLYNNNHDIQSPSKSLIVLIVESVS